MKSKKYTTLFLDRDGVINEKIDGYVKTYSEFKFIDGVLESLKYLSEHFEKIIIVTNQQGIGKKLMTSDDLDRFTTLWLMRLIYMEEESIKFIIAHV